jgi:hypothetical protein
VTLPENDASIDDQHSLLRRVPDRPKLLARRANGELRPSSAALVLREEETGCSVDVMEWLADPRKPLEALTGFPDSWGLARCFAEVPRREDRHRVVGDVDEDNPAHAQMIPTTPSRSKQKRHFGMVAEEMTFLREPQRVEPQ